MIKSENLFILRENFNYAPRMTELSYPPSNDSCIFQPITGKAGNTVEQEASGLRPKTFQEWPSVKQKYGRYTSVFFRP